MLIPRISIPFMFLGRESGRRKRSIDIYRNFGPNLQNLTMRFLYFSLFLIAISGCQLGGDPLPHLWFYTYSSGGETDSLLTPASFLELRKDGSFSRDMGSYESGTWKYGDNFISLGGPAKAALHVR